MVSKESVKNFIKFEIPPALIIGAAATGVAETVAGASGTAEGFGLIATGALLLYFAFRRSNGPAIEKRD